MNRILTTLALGALALTITAPAPAAHHTLQDNVVQSLEGIEKKLVDLAGAHPSSNMSWRPAEGIRSVSEVFMHVAAANYFFSTFVGAEMPEGVNPRSFEKEVTKREDVIDTLKASFAHLKKAVQGVSEDELGDAIKMFGQDSTKRAALLVMVEHASEHLGQSIAYARSNGVAPPWSGGD